MRTTAVCLFLLILVPLAAGTADEELDKLAGKWQVTAMELVGTKLTEDSLGPLKLAVLEFSGERLVIRAGDKVMHEGKFKINANATPKTIEGVLMVAPGRSGRPNRSSIGIYEVDGDTLRICFGPPGSAKPPKEFKTTGPGGGATLVTYQRVK